MQAASAITAADACTGAAQGVAHPVAGVTIAASLLRFAESRTMHDSIKLLHLVAGIVWMGGMTFMLMALRPAALEVLEPQVRARLMGAVWNRFFRVVLIAIAVLLVTGSNLYTATFRAMKESTGAGSVPLGWNLMLVIGVTMVLIFGHIYFAGFKKFKRALAAAEWPVAAKAAAQINRLVIANFVLGWLAIAAVRLVP